MKMMYHVIGPSAWRKFIISVVAKRRFGNVNTVDFFEDIEESISSSYDLTSIRMKNLKLTEIFLPWFTQKGFPTVHIRQGFHRC